MGVDLISPIPTDKRRKTDTIIVFVDHYSYQIHLAPCKTRIIAEGSADLHHEYVFKLHGFPKKVFFDRGPQFAARFMRTLYKHLGIEAGLTTAYHPQGNGKVEHKNQEVEKFLRMFVYQC